MATTRACAAQTGLEDSMSLKAARLIRIFTAVALPVPLFVSIFYFSYFYKSYHGYNFENGTYFTNPMSLANSRKLAWTDFLLFLVVGYVIMLVPSILYSISLEVYRSRPSSSYRVYVLLGGAMGGLASLLYLRLNPGLFVRDIVDVFTAYFLSVFIGAGIAVLLSKIGCPIRSGPAAPLH